MGCPTGLPGQYRIIPRWNIWPLGLLQPLSCGLQLMTSSFMFLWIHVLLCARMSISASILIHYVHIQNEKDGLLTFILCVIQHENRYLDMNHLCDYIVACQLSMST